jgi:hypothetical protein
MSDGGEYQSDEITQGYEQVEAGPSRKRSRHHEDEYGNGNGSGNGHGSGNSYHTEQGRQRHHYEQGYENMPIIPSIFGIPPRNEFTKTIGEFIMNNARGRENVEVSPAWLVSFRL